MYWEVIIMKSKLICSLIMLFVISSSFFASANMKNNDVYSILSDDTELIEVNIALYSSTPIGWDKSAALWYHPILENYTWSIGNKTYKFIITPVSDDNITSGNLDISNYDILLVPGGGVGDEQAIVKGTLPNRPNVVKWKEAIVKYISDGGGYVGYCGGTCLMAELEKKPETILEKNYQRCSIGASSVKVDYKDVANFFTCHFRKDGYKKMGAATYIMWSAYTDETNGYPDYNGLCFDVKLNKSHPIYKDYPEDTCRVRWIGGPALVVPTNSSNNISAGAFYPNEKVCENESQRVHYWKYTGGLIGYIRGVFRGIKWCRTHDLPISEAFIAAMELAPDWDQVDEYVDLNFSGKPCISTEIYPNENEGRIVLNALHPERNVWWGGHIEEAEDTNKNYVAEGLFTLTDYIPFEETPEDEETHTWGMVRREIAWAAKVPDTDLPPIDQ